MKNFIVKFAFFLARIKSINYFWYIINNIPLKLSLTIDGQKLFADSFDRIMALLFYKFKLLDHNEKQTIKKMIKPGMVVIDIGSNFGLYTFFFSELVGNTGRVYAFEPEPRNFHLLIKNMAANCITNVDCSRYAVSDYDGTCRLFVNYATRGGGSIRNSWLMDDYIDVECIKLDTFVNQNSIKEIDFLKIDVEGAEPVVWSGMQDTLKKFKQMKIMLEFNPSALTRSGFDPINFLNEIERKGFIINEVDNNTGQIKTVANEALVRRLTSLNQYTDLLLIPGD